jgi:predicted phage tail protein
MIVRLFVSEDVLTRRHERLREVPLMEGVSLAEMVRAEDLGDVVAIVNGEPIEDHESCRLAAGDEVRVAPRPRDATTIALIAVSLLLSAASAAIAASAAKRIAGDEEPPEKRLGFTRVSHDAFAGGAIPVVMGHRPRYGGKEIAKVPGEGEDGDQRLKILICLGHGEIESIGNQSANFDAVASDDLTGIFFNDQPIGNFPGVKAWGRTGAPSQPVIPGFDDVEILREIGVGGIELQNTTGSDITDPEPQGEEVTYTTIDPVDAVIVRVRLPEGLYDLADSGQVNARRVRYRMRHRLTAGPGAWSAFTVIALEKAAQSEFFSSPRIDGLADGGSPAQRDIQLERVSAEPGELGKVDRLIWDSIVEVVYSDQSYDGFAVLALEIIASEQIQGVPRVAADVKGVKVRVHDGISDPSDPDFDVEYTANPAYLALEWLTNSTWGMGAVYGDADVDFATLIEWAEHADELVTLAAGVGTRPRFAFNHVFDRQLDAIDGLRTICAAGRCVPSTIGKLWRFVVDRQRDEAVETFTDGSIAVDDEGVAIFEYVRELATGGRTRPNRLVAQFENDGQRLLPDVIGWPPLSTLWLETETLREDQIRIEGVTNVEQLVSEIKYRMKRIRFLTRTVRFETTKPVVAVTPGERFDLAMSLPGWGKASGRVRVNSTTTKVKLDRDVTLDVGESHTLGIVHLDSTREDAAVVSPPGFYPSGSDLLVSPALAQAPAEGAEYALGNVGIHVKPFVCLAVRPVDAGTLRWEIEGIEYAEDVYDDAADVVDLPDYSELTDGTTPPGPLTALTCFEREIEGIKHVVLAWSQSPADREITAAFRIYRRVAGTMAWQLTPDAKIAQNSAIIGEIADSDVGFEFVVVAVSYGGAFLSPYDPRHLICSLVFNLGIPPPPPPTNTVLTNTGDNTYTLSWDPEPLAVGYQVLAGGDQASGLPNEGSEGCLVLARTVDPELPGLELTPSQRCDFWVRSVGPGGRLSWFEPATMAPGADHAFEATPATPGGKSIKDTQTFDLSTVGTLVNLTYNATTARLELTDPDSAGTWTSPEIDTGGATLTELTFRADTANDADDPTIDSDFVMVPSIAADQWGVSDDPSTDDVSMIMPPWPDDEQEFDFEIRTNDGVSWGDWAPIDPFESIEDVIELYQIRVTLSRKTAPYRPALRGMTVVATD